MSSLLEKARDLPPTKIRFKSWLVMQPKEVQSEIYEVVEAYKAGEVLISRNALCALIRSETKCPLSRSSITNWIDQHEPEG